MKRTKLYQPKNKIVAVIQFTGKNYNEVLDTLKDDFKVTESKQFDHCWYIGLSDGDENKILTLKINDYIIFKPKGLPFKMQKNTFEAEYEAIV